MPTNRHIY